jgi:integrase
VCKYFESFQSSIDVEKDYVCARKFLLARCVEPNTFPNYRNYIERILLWSWIYAEKSPLALSVNDIRDFVSFNEHPANDWVGSCPRQRFTDNEGYIDFNDAWRPMRNRRSKAMGNCIKIDDEDDSTFQCVTSVSCMVQLLSACSSFYNYMIEIGVGKSNPAALLSKRYANRLRSTKKNRPSLTHEQWALVVDTAETMAQCDPRYERSLFIIMVTYYLYLRGADLASFNENTPCMSSFFERDDCWWFELPGRSKSQIISVDPEFIPYLVRYRESRNLSPLPSPGDSDPLLVTVHGRPGLTDRQIRKIVQNIFDLTLLKMVRSGSSDEQCTSLRAASLAWLRETGAMNAAQFRDLRHLQRDLRYASLAYTMDRYYSKGTEQL